MIELKSYIQNLQTQKPPKSKRGKKPDFSDSDDNPDAKEEEKKSDGELINRILQGLDSD